MATLYTDISTKQLPASAADTWSRFPGPKIAGDLAYIEAIYTLTSGTDEAAADVLRIAKLPANFIVIPHLCKIIAQDPGTAFNLAKIGDIYPDGTAGDDDRYSGAIDISAGGAFDLAYSAAAAGLAGFKTDNEMWLIATLGTVTAPTAGQTVRFVIVGATQS